MTYPTRVPIITWNSDHVEESYSGDAAVSIAVRVSHQHYIRDETDHPILYTGYFRVINKLQVPMKNVEMNLGLEERPSTAVCNVDFCNHNGTEILGDSLSIMVGAVPASHDGNHGMSSWRQYTYTITRARPFGDLEQFGIEVYFWPTFELDYNNSTEFMSRSQAIPEEDIIYDANGEPMQTNTPYRWVFASPANTAAPVGTVTENPPYTFPGERKYPGTEGEMETVELVNRTETEDIVTIEELYALVNTAPLSLSRPSLGILSRGFAYFLIWQSESERIWKLHPATHLWTQGYELRTDIRFYSNQSTVVTSIMINDEGEIAAPWFSLYSLEFAASYPVKIRFSFYPPGASRWYSNEKYHSLVMRGKIPSLRVLRESSRKEIRALDQVALRTKEKHLYEYLIKQELNQRYVALCEELHDKDPYGWQALTEVTGSEDLEQLEASLIEDVKAQMSQADPPQADRSQADQ